MRDQHIIMLGKLWEDKTPREPRPSQHLAGALRTLLDE